MKTLTKTIMSLAAPMLLMSLKPAGYAPGDTIADFALRNVNGKMVALSDYKNAQGLIVVFTCNHCPFAKLYQERMNSLNTRYTDRGFPLIAISANDAVALPEDNYEAMQQRAKEKHYNFPYLYDREQTVAKAFGANKTPQAYVLHKEGNKWVVKYIGAIDDNGAAPEQVKHHFVSEAVDALLAGRPVAVPVTKSVGCGIKWK